MERGTRGIAHSDDHSAPMFLRIALRSTDSRVFLVQLDQNKKGGKIFYFYSGFFFFTARIS